MADRLEWANEQRASFILARLATGGVVRQDLMDHFKCSMPTASAIFKRFQEAYPEAMRYDLTRKAYVPDNKFLHYWTVAAKATV